MILRDTEAAAEFLLSRINGAVHLGTPLGLGKPNHLLNAIYARASRNPARPLHIYTALSLDPPDPAAASGLEARFLGPFLERHFGDYPRLHYVRDQKSGALPAHVRIHEFYVQAGKLKSSSIAQRDYVSLNYTHVAQTLVDRGLNSLVQLVARAPDGRLSLSGNPDLTLDVLDLCRARGRPTVKIGVIHPDLPFLGGDAEVPTDYFDAILDDPSRTQELFAVPRPAIDDSSHLIGFHASRLVADGGTLQIGIGALSDALVHSLLLRHEANGLYRQVGAFCDEGRHPPRPLAENERRHDDTFREGLYGTSEMVMDGFMHLRKAGILRRTVREPGTEIRPYLHGAFFLGSKDFYSWLRSLTGEDFDGLRMTRVSKVNDLYDADEAALRRQRRRARFFNTCMTTTLFGGSSSDTLPDGRVVSGVGGQYNFVAMSHELPDSASVLLMKSTRTEGGRRLSNIVFEGSHLTISRHLRDVVVTEYGAAFLRGRTDEECAEAMIAITDAEFQDELAARAIKAGKLRADYQVPAAARRNTPTQAKKLAGQVRALGPAFGRFPFGSDFTAEEQRILKALAPLKKGGLPKALLAFFTRRGGKDFSKELARLGLARPRGWRERMYAALVLGALRAGD